MLSVVFGIKHRSRDVSGEALPGALIGREANNAALGFGPFALSEATPLVSPFRSLPAFSPKQTGQTGIRFFEGIAPTERPCILSFNTTILAVPSTSLTSNHKAPRAGVCEEGIVALAGTLPSGGHFTKP